VTTSILDRLSALLHGLAFRVSLTTAPKGLALHIMVRVQANDPEPILQDLVSLVMLPRSDQSTIQQAHSYRMWMSFDVALAAMHTDASRPWTLEFLAAIAGMSRTSFATQFKQLIRSSPGKYLKNLRLASANRMVANGVGLKKVARATACASASTLSRAINQSIR
jgi:transcriptional regulator GlxA family with amidase domain